MIEVHRESDLLSIKFFRPVDVRDRDHDDFDFPVHRFLLMNDICPDLSGIRSRFAGACLGECSFVLARLLARVIDYSPVRAQPGFFLLCVMVWVDQLEPVAVGVLEGEALVRTVGSVELESTRLEFASGRSKVIGVENQTGRCLLIIAGRSRRSAGAEKYG